MRGILPLSNSDSAEAIYKALVDEPMGDVHLPRRRENYIPHARATPIPGT